MQNADFDKRCTLARVRLKLSRQTCVVCNVHHFEKNVRKHFVFENRSKADTFTCAVLHKFCSDKLGFYLKRWCDVKSPDLYIRGVWYLTNNISSHSIQSGLGTVTSCKMRLAYTVLLVAWFANLHLAESWIFSVQQPDSKLVQSRQSNAVSLPALL